MDTSDRLRVAMAELMRHQGYAATSIKQVSEAAQATVGSIYHHFPEGKVSLAAAALRTSGAVYIELLPVLLERDPHLPTALGAAFAAAAEDLEATRWANMCPVGTVAGEVANSEPALREVVDDVFSHWVDEATGYMMGRGLAESDARVLAYAVLSALEGAFILARAQRKREPLVAAGAAVAALAASLHEAAPGPARRENVPQP